MSFRHVYLDVVSLVSDTDIMILVFFFKQKTAYEMLISDWSSDVCSSDLRGYKPNDRDLQELDRLRGETSRNTIAPMAARDVDVARGSSGISRQSHGSVLEGPDARRGDRGNTPNDRAAASQMRVDRKSVGEGKGGSVLVDRGGGGITKKN